MSDKQIEGQQPPSQSDLVWFEIEIRSKYVGVSQ